MLLLRPREVACMLKVSPNTLYKLEFRQRWNLPAVRVGHTIRFREEDVKRIIEQGLERFEERLHSV